MATHDYPATSSGPDISGTPSAGNYARFADADTLEARTTAQVLSDIGAVTPSGTPSAGQMAVWSDADTLQGATVWQVLDYVGGAHNTNVRILTEIPLTGAANGYYRFVIEFTRDSGGTIAEYLTIIAVKIASGAVASARALVTGSVSPFSLRYSSESGKLAITLDATTTVATRVVCHVRSSVATESYYAGWTCDNTAPTSPTYIGQGIVAQNVQGSTSVIAGTDPGGSNAIRVGGSIALATGNSVTAATSDAADSAAIGLSGGGALSSTRGGGVTCYGNEHASTGEVVIEAGNVSGGDVDLKTQALSRIKVNYDGTLTFHATTLADLRDQVIRTGHYAVAWTATPATGYLNADGSAVSRATYAALFAVIGTTFGVGDGSTTFNLPDASGLNANDIYLHIKT